MRRLLFPLLLASVTQGALAASIDSPEPAAEANPPGLTDLDGNRISDNLDAMLEDAAPNERFAVVVSFDRPTTPQAAERVVGSFTLRRVLTSINGFSGEMTKAQIEGLTRARGLLRIEPVSTVEAFLEEARFSFGVDAAQTTYTGQYASICVIDTGADANHEQLDRSDGKGVSAAGHFRDLVNGRDDDPYDDHGHGTHVAAIAAGDGVGGNNAGRYRGVAPEAELYAVKALNSAGSGANDVIIQAMEWCSGQGVDIISMSLGDSTLTDGQDAMSQAVNRLTNDYGVIFVTAAGNSGPHPETVGSPACARDSIAVAAVGSWSRGGDYLKAFSSRGPCSPPATWTKPDVAAPGVNVTSASANTVSGYVAYSGTSMATPYIAGVVALAIDARRRVDPASGLNLPELRSLLDDTTTDRGSIGHDLDWGRGLIDADRLVCAAAGGVDCPSTPFPTYSRTTDTIPRSVVREYTFPVDDTSVPIAATLDIVGLYKCIYFGLICGWSPDVELALLDPNGAQLDLSTCPADTDCGAQTLFGDGPNGRQETVRAWPTQTGTYTLQVWIAEDIINDGVSSATFALDVTHGPLVGDGGPSDPPSNEPPVASDDPATTDEDVAVTIPVLANDSNDAVSVASITQPANGTAAIDAGTTVTYTPHPNFNGIDAFTYVASDGALESNTATVTVVVNPVNDPPVAVDDPATTDQNTKIEIDVLANDTDPEGDTLTIQNVGSANTGLITLSSGGTSVAYEPDPLFDGPYPYTDTFEYTVSDGNGGTDVATVMVTVTGSPPSNDPHIGDLDATSSNDGKTWSAEVIITVHDSSHHAVPDVEIEGSWSHGGVDSCTTDLQGTCPVAISGVRKKESSVTFTVTNIGFIDAPDPDGDSVSGTTITVSKP